MPTGEIETYEEKLAFLQKTALQPADLWTIRRIAATTHAKKTSLEMNIALANAYFKHHLLLPQAYKEVRDRCNWVILGIHALYSPKEVATQAALQEHLICATRMLSIVHTRGKHGVEQDLERACAIQKGLFDIDTMYKESY